MNLALQHILLAFLLCIGAQPVRAKPDVWNSHERIVAYPSIGLVYQRELMADISLVRVNSDLWASSNYRLGAETNFNGSHLIVAPKAAGELTLAFGIVRLGLADYWQTNTGRHDLRLTPEIGVTAPNFFTLTFGYNIHLAGFRNGYIGGPKLSLLLCFDREKLKHIRHIGDVGFY